MANGKLSLMFSHPRTSVTYPASVAPECTAGVALQQLQAPATGPFLEPAPQGRPYHLIYKGRTLPHSESFAQAGVKDGEALEVSQDGQGA